MCTKAVNFTCFFSTWSLNKIDISQGQFEQYLYQWNERGKIAGNIFLCQDSRFCVILFVDICCVIPIFMITFFFTLLVFWTFFVMLSVLLMWKDYKHEPFNHFYLSITSQHVLLLSVPMFRLKTISEFTCSVLVLRLSWKWIGL